MEYSLPRKSLLRQLSLLFASMLTLTSLTPFFSRIPDLLKNTFETGPIENMIKWRPFTDFRFYPVRLLLLFLLFWQTGQSVLLSLLGAVLTTLFVEGLNAWEVNSKEKGVVPEDKQIDEESMEDLIQTERLAERANLSPVIENEPPGGHQGINPLVGSFTAMGKGNPAIGHYNPYINK